MDEEPAPETPWYPARIGGELVLKCWQPARCPGCGAALGPDTVTVGRRACSCPTAVRHDHPTWRCRRCGLSQVWRGCSGPMARDGEVAVTWDRWPPADADLEGARRAWYQSAGEQV